MNEADDAFDVVTLIMVIAIFTPLMISYALPFFKGEFGGFNTLIDKTAPPAKREIIPTPVPMTSEDVLLMLVVADRNVPEPKSLRINTSGTPLQITLDESFFDGKIGILQQARAVMPIDVNVSMRLYSGPGNPDTLGLPWKPGTDGMRYWQVQP